MNVILRTLRWAAGEAWEKINIAAKWREIKEEGKKHGIRFIIFAVLWECIEDGLFPFSGHEFRFLHLQKMQTWGCKKCDLVVTVKHKNEVRTMTQGACLGRTEIRNDITLLILALEKYPKELLHEPERERVRTLLSELRTTRAGSDFGRDKIGAIINRDGQFERWCR